MDSAFHVWVNGRPVGFAKGSRLPCEFDVTEALRGTGEQSLCLRVVRWSDGSYLEDQDHWWLSGVYREVELALRPGPSRISDFVVRYDSFEKLYRIYMKCVKILKCEIESTIPSVSE